MDCGGVTSNFELSRKDDILGSFVCVLQPPNKKRGSFRPQLIAGLRNGG